MKKKTKNIMHPWQHHLCLDSIKCMCNEVRAERNETTCNKAQTMVSSFFVVVVKIWILLRSKPVTEYKKSATKLTTLLRYVYCIYFKKMKAKKNGSKSIFPCGHHKPQCSKCFLFRYASTNKQVNELLCTLFQ